MHPGETQTIMQKCRLPYPKAKVKKKKMLRRGDSVVHIN